MATITERLEALESLQEESATLQDRVAALEAKIKEYNDSMTQAEKQRQFLEELPDKQGKDMDEKITGIHDANEQFTQSMKDMSDPFGEKIKDLTERITAMEKAVGISR